jgi:anti-anti-sigma factor
MASARHTRKAATKDAPNYPSPNVCRVALVWLCRTDAAIRFGLAEYAHSVNRPGELNVTMHIFTCEVDIDERRAVAYLNGELDMSTAHCLVDRLRLVAMAGRDLVVDLAGISCFGAAALTALAELDRRATAAGGSIRLSQLPAPVWRLLAVTGTADRFDILQHRPHAAAASRARPRRYDPGRGRHRRAGESP